MHFSLTDLVHLGPILLAGCFALAISLERYRALVVTYPMRNTKYFFEKIRELVMNDRIHEAMAFCDKYPKKLAAQVVHAGLMHAHEAEILTEDALVVAVSEATEKAKARIGYLGMIANVATLLGLLGTILGLIDSFKAIGTLAAKERTAALTAGISTAMYATLMGLAVAIPCMVLFSYFSSQVNQLNAESEQAAGRLMQIIRQRLYGADQSKGPAK